MQSVCLELSKYVLAFLMAFYALAAYRGAVIRNEEWKVAAHLDS